MGRFAVRELAIRDSLLRRESTFSWPRWNIQSALDRGPRQAAFEPSRHLPKAVEVDQFTRLIEPDQVAHPAKHRNVGDGILIVHDPLPSGQMRFHYAKQTS